MAGNNPYDWFRGNYVIDEQVFSAGGMRSHKEFVKWLEENYTIGIHGDPCNWKVYNLPKLDIYDNGF